LTFLIIAWPLQIASEVIFLKKKKLFINSFVRHCYHLRFFFMENRIRTLAHGYADSAANHPRSQQV
jgi:hypothetical protein